LNTAQNFAMLHVALGRMDEAIDMYSRALRGFESVLGASGRRCKDIAASMAAVEVNRMDISGDNSKA